MTLIPLNQGNINQSITQDALYLRSAIEWAKRRYASYNTMLTQDVMTAAGITSDDQAYILAFIGDLNRLIQLSSGTVPSNADDMLYNITHLIGLSN